MKITILIVEDDVESGAILSGLIALKLPGASVLFAGDGRAGLEICRRHAPDIVVTDIEMPDMDGIEMARRIKALKPDTRLIVLTGYSEHRREEFGEIGIHEYFVKPADMKKLLAAIEACLGEIRSP